MGQFLLTVPMGICSWYVACRESEVIRMDRGEIDEKAEDVASCYGHECRNGTVGCHGMEWRFPEAL